MSDYNVDSQGLLNVLSLIQNKKTNGEYNGQVMLTDVEINTLFRDSHLIQKIVTKYPSEAKAIGYKIINLSGSIVEENNPIILDAFYNASVFARLYGVAFLVLKFDDFRQNKPVKNTYPIGYDVVFDIQEKGDFFIINNELTHKDRVIKFYGVKNFSKYNFGGGEADSILQGVYTAYCEWLNSLKNGQAILENLAYLTIGINNLGAMTRTTEGQKALYDRMTSININRSIYKTLAYDKSQEEISFINQTLAGVDDIIEQAKKLFVASSGYPGEVVFEDSPSSKLGSGIQNQLVSRYLFAKRCHTWTLENWFYQYAQLFSKVYDLKNFSIDIPFFVEHTEQEQADLEKVAAERVDILIKAGVITPMEARTGYRNDSFSLNIDLDDNSFKDSQQSKEINEEIKEQNTNETQTDSELSDEFFKQLAVVTEKDLLTLANEMIEGQ